MVVLCAGGGKRSRGDGGRHGHRFDKVKAIDCFAD